MIKDFQRIVFMNDLRDAINNGFFNEPEMDAAMRLLTIMEKRDWIKKKVAMQNQEAALSAYKLKKVKFN